MTEERKRPGNPLYPAEARQIFEARRVSNCWIEEEGSGTKMIRVTYQPSYMVVKPLQDSDFFLSFARLGARKGPSDFQMRTWAAKYGLPKTKTSGKRNRESQKANPEREWHESMTVAEFRQQVLYARQLLVLYTEIQRREVDKLKARAATPQSPLDEEIRKAFRSLDYRNLKDAFKQGIVEEDKAEVQVSFPVLVHDVADYVRQVYVRPVVFLDSLSQSYDCSDLLTALYFQFYLFIRNKTQMRYCDHPTCRTPIPVTRHDRYFCNKTCRSGARHYQ